jgi:acetyl-CoA C-acetyltransferase
MGKADSAFGRDMAIHDTTIGWRLINPAMREQFGVDSMPATAENVAREFGISRIDQDLMALRSQQKALSAIQLGLFAEEITPVLVPQRRAEPVSFHFDEHPRATSIEALGRLKGVVVPDGSVTAGNSSGVNDGACVLLLANENSVRSQGLAPLARIVAVAAAGVAPRLMGIGPVPATRKALALAGLTLADMSIIELNEAFAAQGLAVLRELGLADDDERVNPNGGAIAIGHPLGASGARLVLTAARHLQRIGGRYALCTMCIGVGQGIAIVIERA